MPITMQVTTLLELQNIHTLAQRGFSIPNHISKRSVDPISFAGKSPVYFDSIGQPRNIPAEYKLSDEVADGFSGIWVTPFKNSEQINYIQFNIQRLANYTGDLGKATHEQLAATSLTAYQNRVAVDFLLADCGGVCAMFPDTCCTFILNNTAPDDSLTKALEGLTTLSDELKDHSGINDWLNDWLEKTFGKWRAFALALFVSIAVFLADPVVCFALLCPLYSLYVYVSWTPLSLTASRAETTYLFFMCLTLTQIQIVMMIQTLFCKYFSYYILPLIVQLF